jgi:hypothetical protein
MGAREYDSAGRVKPYDDDSISGDVFLVRYVHRQWLVPDGAGGRRLSKGAFAPSSEQRDPYKGMSTEILDLILNDGSSPTERKPRDHEAAVILKVEQLRALGLIVGHDPIEDLNPYHAAVWGVKRGHQKRLLEICEWIDKPPDVG